MDRIEDKIYKMIGLAQKGGKVSSGATAVETALKKRRAAMLVISRDISANSRKALLNRCNNYNIPWIELGNKDDLGNAIGKAYRVALTINDAAMAQAIIRKIKERE